MKKILLFLLAVVLVSCGIILLRPTQKQENPPLRVAEVTHSLFYAPWYVAIEKGYFTEENLKLEVVVSPGADKVSAAVLSGDVDIGLCGIEAAIYIEQGKEKNHLQTFAGLTKRDGSFIVARHPMPSFTLDDLRGKQIIGGRKGGIPEMALESMLREHQIDPEKDVTINTSIEFAGMQGAFIGGTGDFVTLFEPIASTLVKQKYGYIVGAVGSYSKEVPYTAFLSKKSYLEKHPKTIHSFTKAISKGLAYVHNHSATDIAKTIQPQFPSINLDILTTAIENYKQANVWKENVMISQQELERLQNIMIEASQITAPADYHKIVNTRYFDHE